jgi:two-component system NtrC family response regulator/two-component system response regulator HydG
MSKYGNVETAVRALKEGAYHYFEKPLDIDAVRAVITEALGSGQSGAKSPKPRTANGHRPVAQPEPDGLGIVGDGPWMQDVLDILRRVAPTRATVLLAGPSGTGKELFARAIHRMSGRKGPFVAVSCAALSRELLESELFGHEKGAFTGAERQKIGRFELADGGTLLLDEIGDVPPDLQVKLLRVLQEREIERVGGTETIPVDVRIIAATNRDLVAAVQDRSFREDLYYRLKVIELILPPLRERRRDVEPLARHFVGIYSRANGKEALGISVPALAALSDYPWPGNVRELENAIERAVVLAGPEETEIGVELLPANVRSATPPARQTPGQAFITPPPPLATRFRDMGDGERLRALEEALDKAAGNAAHAAQALGISARSARYHADKWGLWRRGHTRRAEQPPHASDGTPGTLVAEPGQGNTISADEVPSSAVPPGYGSSGG